jgi:DNA polymerase-3 subunit epsilon
VLDTETTGFSPSADRIVEFAAVEVDPRTGERGAALHQVLDPLRPVPPEVSAVHGLGDADVAGKPTFAQFGSQIADFLRGSLVAIQNANFDVRMLDAEFGRARQPKLSALNVAVVDVLDVTRNVFPLLGRYDLDSICDHVGVDRAARTTHGALVDTVLLAETLPKLASEYDAWYAIVDDACASEVDAFESELEHIVRTVNETVLRDSAERIEHSVAQLAALERSLAEMERYFESSVTAFIKEDNWTCKHRFAR